MRISFLFLFIFSFLIVFSQSPKRELRGAWLTTFYNIDWPDNSQNPQQQQQALISILNSYKDAGINTVFMQVRSQCDAMYASTIEPWSSDLTGVQGLAPFPLWDPLLFAVAECHKRALEIHAWINPYRAVSNINLLSSFSSSHIAIQHPEWLLANGNLRSLNPGIPEVRQYILKIIRDIVKRYDLDGIHFDDYFYPEGYVNDDDAFKKYNTGFNNRADWRRGNVNQLIKEVNKEISELKPWVKFGISPSGIYRNSPDSTIGSATSGLEHYTSYFADTRKWLKEGWIDYLIPQVYWSGKQPGSAYQTVVQWWQHETYGRHIYIGIGTYKLGNGEPAWQSAGEVAKQIRFNRSFPSILGESFYNSSSFLSNRMGVLDTIKKMYEAIAIPPEMPWKKIKHPSAPGNLRVLKSPGGNLLEWSGNSSSSELTNYVIYRSSEEQFDINQSSNILKVISDTTFTDKVADTTTWYYGVSALNRLEEESELSDIVSSTGRISLPVPAYPAVIITKKEIIVIKDTVPVKSPILPQLIKNIENPLVAGNDLTIRILVAGNLIYSIFQQKTRITWGKIRTLRGGSSVNLPGTRDLKPGQYILYMEMDQQKQEVPFEVR